MSGNVETVSDYGLDCKNREIYLHSYVGNTDEDPGVEYRMAVAFYKNIRLLDTISQEPIIVHMHSIGGCWNDGMAIFDAISMARSVVTVLVYGQAESMSSIILQAADRRVMMPNAYFMCHYGKSGYDGNYLDVQKAAMFEKRDLEVMLDIYTENVINGEYMKEHYSDPSEEKVKNFLKRKLKDGDWYLSAEEAVYYGFADGILKTQKFPTIDSLK
jgi:ATP-dependent protease ClpP protease subunit